jgi:hypothetical protein
MFLIRLRVTKIQTFVGTQRERETYQCSRPSSETMAEVGRF